jgi:hypothetical protein
MRRNVHGAWRCASPHPLVVASHVTLLGSIAMRDGRCNDDEGVRTRGVRGKRVDSDPLRAWRALRDREVAMT